MSLYYEAASILENAENTGGSLTSRIYGKKGLKSKPTAIYALITEATKWSAVLKDVVEKTDILKLERKLTPLLATLLTHDLLLSKGGVAAPANHPLKLAITRHKARLSAEFTKIRVKRGFSSIDAFRQQINSGASGSDADGPNGTSKEPEHPRWVRVNAVRTTLKAQLNITFKDYERKEKLSDVMSARPNSKVFHVDTHVPDLLALPPRTDLSKTPAYQKGELIIQDKASCFPAYLLDLQPDDGVVIDGCAAPGNKTTHLAAIVSKNKSAKNGLKQRILACERDKRRSGILEKMVNIAGANKIITIKASQDFMDLNPSDAEMQNVSAILLDPSCSGSGIVGRDDDIKLVLPSAANSTTITGQQSRGKKRKRGKSNAVPPAPEPVSAADTDLSIAEETPDDETKTPDGSAELKARLASLSSFQLKILCHAMAFPAARKITYSTCSIHAEENEHVVLKALESPVAKACGWRMLKREQQVDGMKRWDVRGTVEACKSLQDVEERGEAELKEIADACIRCEKGTEEGTMGFFVAPFVRDGDGGEWEGGDDGSNWDGEENGGKKDVGGEDEEDGDEWNGFSDGD